MIGLERGKVLLSEHQPQWLMIAKEHIGRISQALGNLAVEVAHVGSTSVSGLCAKPIIDIAVGVQSFDPAITVMLEQVGYLHRAAHDEDGHMLFVDAKGEITYAHIHIVAYMSMEWRNYVNFRNYLNAYPEQRDVYAAIKRALALEYFDNRERYTAEKADFIKYTLRKAMVWSFLGKHIEARVDRPVGYLHCKGEKKLRYPINYGYIPDVLGGDNEELDVYYLGTSEPLATFSGQVIAIVHRQDDVEDKLVAASLGSNYSAKEICRSIYFQEKYYNTTVETLDGQTLHIKYGETK